ncbi:MAG: rhomboid family intramembrane serine protease [Actinobacteria bacterium]|nr:MAG: rhomboid family intramembrane serine protease [Actinomycetota bacterium]
MAATMTCYRHPNRETGVSCSECGRGICPDCMVFAPVGIRCPDHAGLPQGAARVTSGVRRASFEGTGALVTKAMIAINVLVYLACLAQGSSLGQTSGKIFEKGALYVHGGLDQGEWWRLITAAFLHASILHIGMNMVVLWIVGAPVEQALGRGRFLVLYIVSGLAGSAGALIFSPDAVTVGASGAIFGILGAALVLESQRSYVLGGQAFGLIVINLVLTFAIPNISVGGHLGGLAGGALGTLALSRFGRGHAIYGRPGLIGVVGLVAVGLASVLVAYWRVQGLM